MKKLLSLFLAGILIFGCVSNLFATDYKKFYDVYPQGKFYYDGFVKGYENTLAGAATSVTINNLAGDTDVEYRLEYRFINGGSGVCNYGVMPNNTSLAAHQVINASNTTVSAKREGAGNEAIYFSVVHYTGVGAISMGRCLIYAKSGYLRTALIQTAYNISGTTVNDLEVVGAVWNDTSSNITSLVVFADVANGLGIGTYISLWKKEYRQ